MNDLLKCLVFRLCCVELCMWIIDVCENVVSSLWVECVVKMIVFCLCGLFLVMLQWFLQNGWNVVQVYQVLLKCRKLIVLLILVVIFLVLQYRLLQVELVIIVMCGLELVLQVWLVSGLVVMCCCSDFGVNWFRLIGLMMLCVLWLGVKYIGIVLVMISVCSSDLWQLWLMNIMLSWVIVLCQMILLVVEVLLVMKKVWLVLKLCVVFFLVFLIGLVWLSSEFSFGIEIDRLLCRVFLLQNWWNVWLIGDLVNVMLFVWFGVCQEQFDLVV